jgi:hypothetical protein
VLAGSFETAIFAKVLMGAGFDPLLIAGRVILTKWFFGRELGFATNLNLATSRIIVFLNGIITPTLADTYSISAAFMGGLLFCICSLASTCFILKLHN